MWMRAGSLLGSDGPIERDARLRECASTRRRAARCSPALRRQYSTTSRDCPEPSPTARRGRDRESRRPLHRQASVAGPAPASTRTAQLLRAHGQTHRVPAPTARPDAGADPRATRAPGARRPGLGAMVAPRQARSQTAARARTARRSHAASGDRRRARTAARLHRLPSHTHAKLDAGASAQAWTTRVHGRNTRRRSIRSAPVARQERQHRRNDDGGRAFDAGLVDAGGELGVEQSPQRVGENCDSRPRLEFKP